MFELTDAQTLAMRNAARDATISAAKAFGFGGADWSVERWTGDGVTAARVGSGIANITGYAYRQRPGVVALAVVGAPVPDDIWRLIVIDGELEEGDIVTSTATSEQLTIMSVESWYDYVRCDVERHR